MAFWSSGRRLFLRRPGEAVNGSGQTRWFCNADNATALFLDVSVNYRKLFTLKMYEAFYLQFINSLYVVLLQYKSLKNKRIEMTLEQQIWRGEEGGQDWGGMIKGTRFRRGKSSWGWGSYFSSDTKYLYCIYIYI